MLKLELTENIKIKTFISEDIPAANIVLEPIGII